MAPIFLLACATAGLLVLHRLAPSLSRVEQVLGGTLLGLAGGTALVCALAAALGLTPLAVWTGAGLGLAGAALLGLPLRGNAPVSRQAQGAASTKLGPPFAYLGAAHRGVALVWASLAGLLSWLHLHMMYPEGDILVMRASNWSDLGNHAAFAHTMAQVGVVPPSHPYVASQPLVYHWGVDALSALLEVAAGEPSLAHLRASILGPDLVFSLTCLGLLACLARRCGLGGWGTLGGVGLAALGGGLGFYLFGMEHPANFWHALGQQTRPCDVWPERGLYWSNLVRDHFLHSRTEAPALALWLLVCVLLLSAEEALPPAAVSHPPDTFLPEGASAVCETGLPPQEASFLASHDHDAVASPKEFRAMWALAGVLMGLLPMVNVHVFVGGGCIVLLWLVCTRPQALPVFGGAATLVALGCTAWLRHLPAQALPHPQWGRAGWLGSQASLLFWLRNVGPLILVGPLGARYCTGAARRLVLASMAGFALGNLLILADPWANQKLMLPWFLLACLGAAAGLQAAWQRGGVRRGLALGAWLLSVPTGVLALAYNLVPNDYNCVHYFQASQVPVCRHLARISESRAVVLCEDSDALGVTLVGGRRCYVALPDYVRAQGLYPREALAVREGILRGDPRAGQHLVPGQIDFVVLPQAGARALTSYLEGHGCVRVFADPNYALFLVGSQSLSQASFVP